MNVLEAVRKLGEAMQQDERFIRFAKARVQNDNNEELQQQIGSFNVTRMELDRLMSEENRNEDKIRSLNEDLRKVYAEIMSSECMVEYNTAKNDVDAILNDINSMIMQCADGADPATCEPETHSCSGSCSTCGGCH